MAEPELAEKPVGEGAKVKSGVGQDGRSSIPAKKQEPDPADLAPLFQGHHRPVNDIPPQARTHPSIPLEHVGIGNTSPPAEGTQKPSLYPALEAFLRKGGKSRWGFPPVAPLLVPHPRT